MLRSLKEVQGDDSVVGFYLATNTGAFLNSSLVEMQALHQERLRQGGIVIVHGQYHHVLRRSRSVLNLPFQTYRNPKTAMQLSALSALPNHSLMLTSETTLVSRGKQLIRVE
jgi:hypothetical protein